MRFSRCHEHQSSLSLHGTCGKVSHRHTATSVSSPLSSSKGPVASTVTVSPRPSLRNPSNLGHTTGIPFPQTTPLITSTVHCDKTHAATVHLPMQPAGNTLESDAQGPAGGLEGQVSIISCADLMWVPSSHVAPSLSTSSPTTAMFMGERGSQGVDFEGSQVC